MTKRKTDISEYVGALEASQILSQKLGRPIQPDYVRKIKGIRRVQVKTKMYLYLRSDVENATVRQKGASPTGNDSTNETNEETEE